MALVLLNMPNYNPKNKSISFGIISQRVFFFIFENQIDQDVLDLENLEHIKQPNNGAVTGEKQQDKLTSLEMQLAAASGADAEQHEREEEPPYDGIGKTMLDSDIIKSATPIDDIHSETVPSSGGMNTNSNSERPHGAQPKVNNHNQNSFTLLYQ